MWYFFVKFERLSCLWFYNTKLLLRVYPCKFFRKNFLPSRKNKSICLEVENGAYDGVDADCLTDVGDDFCCRLIHHRRLVAR